MEFWMFIINFVANSHLINYCCATVSKYIGICVWADVEKSQHCFYELCTQIDSFHRQWLSIQYFIHCRMPKALNNSQNSYMLGMYTRTHPPSSTSTRTNALHMFMSFSMQYLLRFLIFLHCLFFVFCHSVCRLARTAREYLLPHFILVGGQGEY